MNLVTLIGRLTSTPSLKQTPNGKSVCNFSVAVDRKFKDASGQAITDYVDCVVWNQAAEFLCKWFDKGVRVGLTGELQTRMYEKDGKKNKVVEVLVSTVEFADGKREANTNNGQAVQSEAPINTDEFIPIGDADDLPWN